MQDRADPTLVIAPSTPPGHGRRRLRKPTANNLGRCSEFSYPALCQPGPDCPRPVWLKVLRLLLVAQPLRHGGVAGSSHEPMGQSRIPRLKL